METVVFSWYCPLISPFVLNLALLMPSFGQAPSNKINDSFKPNLELIQLIQEYLCY